MKVLIWVVMALLYGLATQLVYLVGISLGGFETILLAVPVVFGAPYLCKKWDKRQSEKSGAAVSTTAQGPSIFSKMINGILNLFYPKIEIKKRPIDSYSPISNEKHSKTAPIKHKIVLSRTQAVLYVIFTLFVIAITAWVASILSSPNDLAEQLEERYAEGIRSGYETGKLAAKMEYEPQIKKLTSENKRSYDSGYMDARYKYLRTSYTFNGEILISPDYIRNCPLTVSVRGEYSYYVRLCYFGPSTRSESERKPTSGYELKQGDIAFFVDCNSTVEIDVPVGVYKLYYCTGTTWYGFPLYFDDETKWYTSDETLEFYTDRRMEYGVTLDLYTRYGGNYATKNIDAAYVPFIETSTLFTFDEWSNRKYGK